MITLQVSDDEGTGFIDSYEDEDAKEFAHEAAVDQDAGESVSQAQRESLDWDGEDGIFWYDPCALR